MRVGLLLSRDGGAISKTVDVDALSREYSHLAVSKAYDSFFSYADQQDMLRIVEEKELEAVVLAGNSPKYFERVLSGTQILDALKSRGINENKIAFANIKEQVALPHRGSKEEATHKARLLIDAALAKVELCHAVESIAVAPRRAVLVVGASAGGIIAAKELLAKDYRVCLIDRGSSVRELAGMEEEMLPALTAVQASDKATILFNTALKDVSGWCGDYRVALSTEAGEEEVSVGGIIVAVGDDTEWIRELRPKLQLDVNSQGLIRDRRGIGSIGQTVDPGIRFVPSENGADGLAKGIGAATMSVLSLTTILDRNEIEHLVKVSEVDETVCGGCGTCVKTCAFAASSIDLARKVSVIDPMRCKGCGNCVVACPTGARDLVAFPREYVTKAIDILSRGAGNGREPKVLAILCNSSGYLAADAAGELSGQLLQLEYPANVMPLCVECGGNVDTQYILEAFSKGFDGVVLSVCRDGSCHHVVGEMDMQRRLGLFREVLRSRNIDSERLRIVHVSPGDGRLFSEEINDFCRQLKAETAAERRMAA